MSKDIFQKKCSLTFDKPYVRNRVAIPTGYGISEFCSFSQLEEPKEHVALIFKNADSEKEPLIRIHSECLTGDIFSSNRCDCGDQLQEALQCFSEQGGILLYLRQEGRGIGLYNKLDAYELQLKGLDTYEANQRLHFADDLRCYRVAAQMLQALNVTHVKLLTNNPQKVEQLQKFGIEVVEQINTACYFKPENIDYLVAKSKKTGHNLLGLSQVAYD